MSQELTRFEIADVKAVNKRTAPYRTKMNKIEEKVEELVREHERLEGIIETWEAPIVKLTGYTSDIVLAGLNERVFTPPFSPQTEEEEETNVEL